MKANLCSHFERFLHMIIDDYSGRLFVSLSMVERGGKPRCHRCLISPMKLELTTGSAIGVPSFASAVLRTLAPWPPESGILFLSSSVGGVCLFAEKGVEYTRTARYEVGKRYKS